MAIEVEGKYQQRYSVSVLAISDVGSKESVDASQPLNTQQLIETSAILFDHPRHFFTLSVLHSLISNSHKPFTSFFRLSA
jgi:hypothetical protein